jgi:transposase
MKRFIESESRAQATLFPERLEDWIAEDNPMRAVDAFVDELDLATIADFRRDNGPGLRQACRQFVQLCRQIGLFEQALVAIDGSKFKAVNNRDKNFTPHKLKARR